MLVASALLAVVQMAPGLVAVVWYGGLGVALGNRENVPPLPEWANRADRAQRNLIANLLPFAALVLAAQQAGIQNADTAFGATLFFWSRLVYAIVYIAGIPYLRTLAFVASLAGMFDIAAALLAAWGGAGAA